MKSESKFDDYLERCNGRELLKEHNLTEEGTWEVRGEDPNCDLGGPHHEPFLGIYQGKLADVVEFAVNHLPGFWAWGAGGVFKKVKINSVPMVEYPKIRGKSECLGFRKTIVLNKDEHTLLNNMLDHALDECESYGDADPGIVASLRSMKEKLNAPTPNSN